MCPNLKCAADKTETFLRRNKNTDKLSIKQRWMQIDKLANIQTEIETDRKIVI